MAKIISIKSFNNDNEVKKAIDGQKDTYWSTFKGNGLVIDTDEGASNIKIDFQRGFHPKVIKLQGKEIKLDKNEGMINVSLVKYDCGDKLELTFVESYDPYGRIFVYEVFVE